MKHPHPTQRKVPVLSTPEGIRKMFENICDDLAKKKPEDVQAVVIYSSADNLISIAHTEDEQRCNELLDMAMQALAQQGKRPPDIPLQ